VAAVPVQDLDLGRVDAVEFMVRCDTQDEIDRYWDALAEDGTIEQCGWVRDRYGLCWQIVPTVLQQMMADQDRSKVKRVTEAFLQMKKLDIATLQRAFDGT